MRDLTIGLIGFTLGFAVATIIVKFAPGRIKVRTESRTTESREVMIDGKKYIIKTESGGVGEALENVK